MDEQRAQWIRDECDYWTAVLEDMQQVNERLGVIASASTAIATAAIGIALEPRTSTMDRVEAVLGATREIVQATADVQTHVRQVGDAAGGRAIALKREIDSP